jgi:Holin of 3TMs, for gene-transfer release
MSILDFVGGDAFSKILDRVLDFIPNPAEKARKKQDLLEELQKAAIDTDKDNRAINLEEAKHPSLFIAGWRPMVGWVCALAFAWLALLNPVLNFFIVALGYAAITIPMDQTLLITTLGALLGNATLRTWEKIQEADTKRISKTK